MECGQFVGKVKPETWCMERLMMELHFLVLRFGGGNPVFFENFRGGICFFLGED